MKKNKDFGDLLRLLIKRTLPDITQYKLAKILGWHPTTISHWCCGTRKPGRGDLLDLIKFLQNQGAQIYLWEVNSLLKEIGQKPLRESGKELEIIRNLKVDGSTPYTSTPNMSIPYIHTSNTFTSDRSTPDDVNKRLLLSLAFFAIAAILLILTIAAIATVGIPDEFFYAVLSLIFAVFGVEEFKKSASSYSSAV